MKTLIVIGYVWPEPNSSAAGSHMLQLLDAFLADGYRVIFASPAERGGHAVDLSERGVESVSISLNCSDFDHWIAEIHPDVVMFDRFMMEEQFGWRVEEQCPNALRLLDMEDVHSLRDARHRAVKAGREVEPDDWYTDMAFREIASILRCDLTLVISEYEMTWLTNTFPIMADQLCYLPFMVDSVEEASLNYDERQHFISIGNFRHAPNWDAVLQLKELWPNIRRELPQAELHIYGAYPPPKATQLHNPAQGFLVKGWADDAADVIRRARVMLAPLRFGAGLKGKLLEAAMYGTPAVTSKTGAEGMYGDMCSPALVVDSARSFIDSAVELYRNQVIWMSLSDAGPPMVKARYNRLLHQQRLIDAVNAIRVDLLRHRRDHFVSGMLNHHRVKSSRYMSQWIEAKNRLKQETLDS